MDTQTMNYLIVGCGILYVLYLAYGYKDTVLGLFGKNKIQKEEKKIEKAKINYRNRDEECIDYLATRANALDDSEDRLEVIALVDELNSRLFRVHYDYDVEETEDA